MKKLLLSMVIVGLALSTVAYGDPLPQGYWTDLLHLGADYNDRIDGGQIDTDYLGGEASIMPYPGQEISGIAGATADPMVWTPLNDPDGTWQPNFENYVMYWHIYIISPDDRDVRFHFGHDDDLRMWNNGELVVTAPGAVGDESRDGVLHAGLNSITIKLKEGGGADYMRMEVTDRAGAYFNDLTYTFAPNKLLLKSQITGRAGYTNDPTVDVAFDLVDATNVMYQITETETEPTEWLPAPPATYTLTGDEGTYTIYGWVKTGDGMVQRLPEEITYTTIAPVVMAKDISVEMVAPNYPPAVVYAADVDDGSYGSTGGEIVKDPQFYYLESPDNLTPGEAYVTLDATAETNYLCVLNVMNEAGTAASVPFAVNIIPGAEPTTGDVVWKGSYEKGNLEWFRSMNWQDAQAPVNPTDATVTFTSSGGNEPGDESITSVAATQSFQAVSSNAEPFALVDNSILSVDAGSGAQIVYFAATDFADITAATAAEVANAMNASFVSGLTAAADGGKVVVTADSGNSLTFANLAETPADVLGFPTDHAVTPGWTIGKLVVKKMGYDVQPPSVQAPDFAHNIDLDGGRLTVKGDFEISRYPNNNHNTDRGRTDMSFTNGTLQIGTPEAKSNMYLVWVPYGCYNTTTVKLAPGTVFDPYVNTLRIADNYSGQVDVALDLRGATVANSILSLDNLYLAQCSGGTGSLMIDDTTGLDTLQVANDLVIANGAWVAANLGDPGNQWKLPANFNIKVGSKDGDTVNRGTFYVMRSTYRGGDQTLPCVAQLEYSSGGTFEVYADEFMVGSKSGWYGGTVTGTLDLSSTDSCIIDAVDLKVGAKFKTDANDVGGEPRGYMYLPSGASVNVATVEMGAPSVGGEAIMDVPGTAITVSDSVTMRDHSTMTIHVQGNACGLDLADTANLVAEAGSKIDIRFEAEQDAAESGIYYGLRWKGDHAAYLQPLVNDGLITWDDQGVAGFGVMYYDSATDYTYVAALEQLPLIAVANNLSIEVASATDTVQINAADLDAGSYDPAGDAVTLSIASGDDQTPTEDYITLSGLGEHEVVFTVARANTPAETAFVVVTVTLYESAAKTANDVVWTGAAALAGDERPEWSWGSNWQGGEAPMNPTTAKVTFTNMPRSVMLAEGSTGDLNKLTVGNAVAVATAAEPYVLNDGDVLSIDAGGTATLVTFDAAAFADMAAATAQEVVDLLNANANGYSAMLIDGKPAIVADAGLTLQVSDVAGTVAAVLGFSTEQQQAEVVVGTLDYYNPTGSGLIANVSHTTDLNGQTLVITKSLQAGIYISQGDSLQFGAITGTFTNGTVQVGRPDAPADISLAFANYNTSAEGNVIFGENTSFVPYVRNIVLGDGRNPTSTSCLDLRQANLVGGVLDVDNIIMGDDEQGGGFRSSIKVGPNTGLTDIIVANKFSMGAAPRAWCYFGDPDNDWKLPADVNIKVGSAEAPGSFTMALSPHAEGESKLIASQGGTFEANVDVLYVANLYEGFIYGGWRYGTLDLQAMNSCDIAASDVKIGTIPSTMTDDRVKVIPVGKVYLPTGTFAADTVELGTTGSVNGPNAQYFPEVSALVSLNGTSFTVSQSLAMKPKSELDIAVPGTSVGLELAESATLEVADQAAINIAFDAPAGSGNYWGLRWGGNHVDELQAMADAGKISWNEPLVDQPVVIYFVDGSTYIGLAGGVTRITTFEVSDATSGSTLYTNSDTVSINLIAEPGEGKTIAGYAITEDEVEPTDGWAASITTYTIQVASPGADIMLYAWAMDSSGAVVSRPVSIFYQPNDPVVSNLLVADNGDGTLGVSWATDIFAYGGIKYKVQGAAAYTTLVEDEPMVLHNFSIPGFQTETTYEIVVFNNEKQLAPILFPEPAQTWPIEGDANLDCKVNIIDLIFVRNRLNKDVTSGDNWQADVNGDGKVNIIDLIYVRNRLNNKCPQ